MSIAVGIQRTRHPQRSPYAPKFEDRSREETLRQERCTCRDAWELAKKRSQAQQETQSNILLAFRCSVSFGAILNESRGKIICCRFGSISAHADQERPTCSRTGNRTSIQNPHNGHHTQWESANERGSSSVCQRFGFIRDGTAPRGYAARSIAWADLRRSRTDIPMSGPVVKSHTSSKTPERFHATQKTMCPSLCQRVNRGLAASVRKARRQHL